MPQASTRRTAPAGSSSGGATSSRTSTESTAVMKAARITRPRRSSPARPSPRSTGEDDRNAARGLDAPRERLLIPRPVRLDDVGPQLRTQANVPTQVLEAVLLLECFDRRVRGRELGLGDERHAECG